MAGYNPLQILEELEQEMSGCDFSASITALPGDKWLAASSMQKAIRRGHTDTALRAAMSLWLQDRRSFWRRAQTISVEDVGPASPETVVKVMTVHEAPAWRLRVGDLRTSMFLIKLMSEAVKCRIAEQQFTICSLAPEYQNLRQELSSFNDDSLADNALDNAMPLQRRVLSLWLLAGTRRFPSENLPERRGSPGMAAEVLRGLNAPAALTESCLVVSYKTRWPLILFTPLLWTELQKQPHLLSVCSDPLPELPHVEGIPIYGADQFTRIGKACLLQFKKAVPALKPFSSRQLGICLFYMEGEKTDKTLTSPALEEYRHAGELADAKATGLGVPQYLDLRECMADNLHILHDIRQQQLQRYLDGGME